VQFDAMTMDKPRYLYHGSLTLVTELIPRPAHGVGLAKDQFRAVYASHVADFAIAFALPLTPSENGGYAWKMDFDPAKPEIIILAGSLDLFGTGYVYRVPSDSFEPIDDLQWVSYEPVVPVDYEVIDPAEYAHWVRYAGADGDLGDRAVDQIA